MKSEMRAKQQSGGLPRDPLALLRPDWIALGLLAVALILAPLCAGTFATPPSEGGAALPDGLINRLASIGLAFYAELFIHLQTAGSALIAILVSFAVIIQVWREWRRPVAVGAAPFLAGAALLLACWAALSLVRSQALYLSLNALMALFTSLASACLIARLCRDRKGVAALLVTLVVAGTLVSVLGISEYMFAWNPMGKGHDPLHRTSATFLNPDFLAGYLLLTLPVTLAAFTASVERSARLGLGFGLALQSACLLLTASRAGLIALILGILAWIGLCAWSGIARQRIRRIGSAIALIALGALMASAPARSRLVTAPQNTAPAAVHPNNAPASAAYVPPAPVTQSQSLLFRRYTWQGTQNLIKANPLLGTGIGTFEIAYPRYAITAYTAHAHNSLLQWTGDTGIPGAMLLLTVFAAAAAFTVNVMRLRRDALRNEPDRIHDRIGATFEEPALLLSGLLCALLASSIKTFFDSDWYIVATVLTLCVVVALLVGLARDVAPLATQTPRPLSQGMLIAGVAVALLMIWRAGQTGLAHLYISDGIESLQERKVQPALDSFRSAMAADPFDPEPRLNLATFYAGVNRPDEQRAALLSAAHAAPIAKVYYRLGQFYAANRDFTQAITAYRRALAIAPNNLQVLRHLAETLDQAGQADEAITCYRTMTQLETSPYGTVRAIADEMVETEFAYAHAGLASIAVRQKQWDEAMRNYSQAAAIMEAYWIRRHWLVYEGMSEQKRVALTTLYQEVLSGWLTALHKQAAAQATIQAVTDQQSRVEEDVQQDQEAQSKSVGGGQ